MSDQKKSGLLSALAKPESKENIEFTSVAVGASAALVAAGAVISGAAVPVIAGAAITSAAALVGSKLAHPAITMLDALKKAKESLATQVLHEPINNASCRFSDVQEAGLDVKDCRLHRPRP